LPLASVHHSSFIILLGSAAWNWSENGGVRFPIFFLVRLLRNHFARSSCSLLAVRFVPARVAWRAEDLPPLREGLHDEPCRNVIAVSACIAKKCSSPTATTGGTRSFAPSPNAARPARRRASVSGSSGPRTGMSSGARPMSIGCGNGGTSTPAIGSAGPRRPKRVRPSPSL